MLLYGFEILGYENLDDIDRVYLNFLTHILIYKQYYTSYMIRYTCVSNYTTIPMTMTLFS